MDSRVNARTIFPEICDVPLWYQVFLPRTIQITDTIDFMIGQSSTRFCQVSLIVVGLKYNRSIFIRRLTTNFCCFHIFLWKTYLRLPILSSFLISRSWNTRNTGVNELVICKLLCHKEGLIMRLQMCLVKAIEWHTRFSPSLNFFQIICLTIWACVCGLLKSNQWCSIVGCKS